MLSSKEIEQVLAGRKVLITGHTGFTGSWASLWFDKIGARVCGYALAPRPGASLYNDLDLDHRIVSVINDINNFDAFSACVRDFQPDAILHLAAQPLVRASFRDPLWTFATNAMGTANVLEAARTCDSVKAVLCITTDKVYENREDGVPFTEDHPLGDKEPYSCSKAAAEMVIKAYMNDGWQQRAEPLAIAVARGGNIIGGGDWSEDRIVPDFARAVMDGKSLELRNPDSVRPWQHVLALVDGYMHLLAGLLTKPDDYRGAWNLGPQEDNFVTVRDVVENLSAHWQRPGIVFNPSPLPESHLLRLDSSKAQEKLGWSPVWDTAESVRETALWYKNYANDSASAATFTLDQIDRWRLARGAA